MADVTTACAFSKSYLGQSTWCCFLAEAEGSPAIAFFQGRVCKGALRAFCFA